jgi:hypothetical protein
MFLAAPALRTAKPIMVSAAIIKRPIPPEIAAIEGDEKLRCARSVRRQIRFARPRDFAKKLPQAKSAVANRTSHGTRRAKIDGGVARRMSAPRPPPTRLMTNNLRIVSPVGTAASARPVNPVTSCAGKSATVEVMLAARASMPVSISDGRVMNEPLPASAFCTPAQIAAMKRTMNAVIRRRFVSRELPRRAAVSRPAPRRVSAWSPHFVNGQPLLAAVR